MLLLNAQRRTANKKQGDNILIKAAWYLHECKKSGSRYTEIIVYNAPFRRQETQPLVQYSISWLGSSTVAHRRSFRILPYSLPEPQGCEGL